MGYGGKYHNFSKLSSSLVLSLWDREDEKMVKKFEFWKNFEKMVKKFEFWKNFEKIIRIPKL